MAQDSLGNAKPAKADKNRPPEEPTTEDPNRNQKGQFVPGNRANPTGRPKGSISLTSILRKLLRDPDKDDPTISRADRIMEMAAQAAEKGDFNFFKEIIQRIDGKVPDKVEANIGVGWEMVYETNEDEKDAPEEMNDT